MEELFGGTLLYELVMLSNESVENAADIAEGVYGAVLERYPIARSCKLDHEEAMPVKSQGQCVSCWRHTTTGYLESDWPSASDFVWVRSEQQFANCDTVDAGCDGVLVPSAPAPTDVNVTFTKTVSAMLQQRTLAWLRVP